MPYARSISRRGRLAHAITNAVTDAPHPAQHRRFDSRDITTYPTTDLVEKAERIRRVLAEDRPFDGRLEALRELLTRIMLELDKPERKKEL